MSRKEWLEVAQRASADDLREWILTGFKDGKPFTPYVPTVDLAGPIESVLDFGCGVGRNFPYLRGLARRVTGFDLPPMIERCRELAPVSPDALSDDWTTLRNVRFDAIFSSLVFQHIERDQSLEYLRDFARMAPTTYLLTRGQSDFDHNVIALIEDTGLFQVVDCVEVEHDAATHQLRRVGPASIVDAKEPGEMRHYEVMLRPRPPAPS
jgi:SAM-dependent methyltransferase